jgi:hypothetical protein
MRRYLTLIEESAKQWGVSPRVAWLIFWLPIVGGVVILLTYLNRDLYRFVTMEDGPIEWAQFAFYALTAIASAGIAARRLRSGHQWQALLFAGFALMNLFVAGEEIAWGQRIFGIETPETLREINDQGETTIHNIGIIQDIFNFGMFLIAAYGAVAYVANRKWQIARRWDQANYLLVPPAFLASSFLFTFVYKLIRYTVVRQPSFTVTKYAEWAELCLAFGFFLFTWMNNRRLAGQAKTVAVPSAAQEIAKS